MLRTVARVDVIRNRLVCRWLVLFGHRPKQTAIDEIVPVKGSRYKRNFAPILQQTSRDSCMQLTVVLRWSHAHTLTFHEANATESQME